MVADLFSSYPLLFFLHVAPLRVALRFFVFFSTVNFGNDAFLCTLISDLEPSALGQPDNPHPTFAPQSGCDARVQSKL